MLYALLALPTVYALRRLPAAEVGDYLTILGSFRTAKVKLGVCSSAREGRVVAEACMPQESRLRLDCSMAFESASGVLLATLFCT